MKKITNASYTVEAVLIMNITIFIIVAIIYMGFYLYDYNRIWANTDIIIQKSNELIRKEADIISGKINYNFLNNRLIYWRFLEVSYNLKHVINDFAIDEIGKGLFITKVNSVLSEVSNKKITIKIAAHSQIPFMEVKKLFLSDYSIATVIEIEKNIYDPTEFIRNYDAVKKMAGNIDGIDKNLRGLQKLLEKVGE